MNPRERKTDAVHGKHARVEHGNPRAKRAGISQQRAVPQSATGSGFYSRQSPNPRQISLNNKNAKNKKHKGLKRFLIVLAICLAVVGVALTLYSMALNNALSKNTDTDFVSRSTDYSKPFYMLLLGSDSREGSGTSQRADESGTNQRSDVMVLMRMNLPKKEISMITVPRDTPWTDGNGNLMKINEAYNIGGPSKSVEAVEEVTGVSISHYAEIHVSQLQDLVESLGGVEVNVPTAVSVKDTLTGETISLLPGNQTLTGKQAQAFARARHEYGTNQDAQRQSNVRTLLEAIAKKVVGGSPLDVPNKVLEAARFVGTDLISENLLSMCGTYLTSFGKLKITSCSGPSNGAINSQTKTWLCYKNPQGWANLFATLDAGGDPKSVDFASTQIVHY